MTNQEELTIRTCRAISAARKTAEEATAAAQSAHHAAAALFCSALGLPLCPKAIAQAQSAQTHAALMEAAAANARMTLYYLLQAQKGHARHD